MADLSSLKTIHWSKHYDCDQMGEWADEWWCQECRVMAPCRTMAMGDDLAAIRALHYSAEYKRKIRDGWFKSHWIRVELCHEDTHDFPCLTARLIGEQSG